jgi:hypothetical protein
MPKVSKATTENVNDFPLATDRSSELDGYTVNFVSIKQDHSLRDMLACLPEGRCWCPHWGYVLQGEITVTYADSEETYEAGDAFYMSPGHVPAATAGSEFLQISPTDAFAETMQAIQAGMQANA